jgi:hypothetical protein
VFKAVLAPVWLVAKAFPTAIELADLFAKAFAFPSRQPFLA